MAKIVYGVSGEGSGHSSRAREMAGHLQRQGHDVKLVSYDRGYRNLKDSFEVVEIEGLHIASADNEISVIKTITENLRKLPAGGKKVRRLRRRVFEGFQPDCVITDFEPTSAYLANHYDLPLITIDNQHRMRYMAYPCPPELKADQLLTQNIIRAMVPRPDVSLVTSFYDGEPTNDRTFIYPPILRAEVRAAEPSRGNHILVYLTKGFESFLDLLPSCPREHFLVYGYERNDSDRNLRFKQFSSDGFLTDLATCKAVMATAGFTLMTEAFHLYKPFLALPMKGQFEQELNGYLLALLNYGANVRRPAIESIGNFLYRLPDYHECLDRYPATDNSAIQQKLDELLAESCRLAKMFHQRRVG